MATTEEIKLLIKADADRASKQLKTFNEGLGGVHDRTNKLSKSLTGLKSNWLALSVGMAGAVSVIGKTVKASSNLEETTSKFNTVFSGVSKDMSAAVKNLTDNYAMSTRESRLYLSSVQDLLVPMGMAKDSAADMSVEVVKLSADLGSFNNLPTSQVMADIQSALVGNFETMKKYGVVLNETVIKQEAVNKGLWDGKGMIDANTKAQVAYSLIVKGSEAAIGDMGRTSGSYANVIKKLEANMEDLGAELGGMFVPAIKSVAEIFASAAKKGGILKDALRGIMWSISQVVKGYALLIGYLDYLKHRFSGHEADLEAATKKYDAMMKSAKTLMQQLVKTYGEGWRKEQEALSSSVYKEYIKQKQKIIDQQKEITALTQTEGNYIKRLNDLLNENVVVHKDSLDEKVTAHKVYLEKIAEEEKVALSLKKARDEESNLEAVYRYTSYAQSILGVTQSIVGQISAVYQQSMQNQITALNEHNRKVMESLKSEYEEKKKYIQNNIKNEEKRNKALEDLEAEYNSKTEALRKSADIKKRLLIREGAKKQKKISIIEATISTLAAAINAYRALASIPYVGPALGAAAAAVASAYGMNLVGLIKSQPIPEAFEGAVVKGTQSGSVIRAGERGQTEAILPLENEEAMEKLGGVGGKTYIFNIDNLYATDEMPQEVAQKIDQALYKLHQSKESRFGEVLA